MNLKSRVLKRVPRATSEVESGTWHDTRNEVMLQRLFRWCYWRGVLLEWCVVAITSDCCKIGTQVVLAVA